MGSRGRKTKGYIRVLDTSDPNGKCELSFGRDHYGTFATRAEAERERRTVLEQLSGTGPNIFAKHGEKWWSQREGTITDPYYSRKTYLIWTRYVRQAPWYSMPLRAITPAVAQQWVDWLAAQRAVQPKLRKVAGAKPALDLIETDRLLSPSRMRDILQVVRGCFDGLVISGALAGMILPGKGKAVGNPFRLVKLPTRLERWQQEAKLSPADDFDDEDDEALDEQLIVHLTATQIAALFALDQRQMYPHHRCAYAIAIYCGLRRSEILGLQLRDIILDGPEPEIRVRRSCRRKGQLKSKWARRDIPLLPQAVAEIRAYLDYLAAQGIHPIGRRKLFLRTDTAYGPRQLKRGHGEAFANTYDFHWRRSGGKHTTPRERAGIPDTVTFHALRHTCGSHLLQGSWTARPLSMEVVSRWLGHSSIAVTERHYAALTKHSLHRAIKKTRKLLRSAITPGNKPGNKRGGSK